MTLPRLGLAGILAFTMTFASTATEPAYAQRGEGYVVRVRPPQRRAEARPRSPGRGYVWQSGDWRWNGRSYVWAKGRWARPPRADVVWVEPRWVSRNDGYYAYVPGRWETNRSYIESRASVRVHGRDPYAPPPPPPAAYGYGPSNRYGQPRPYANRLGGVPEAPPGVVRGQPSDFGAPIRDKVWIWWSEDGTWHMRVNSGYERVRFTGRVSAPGGQMVRAYALGERGDTVVIKNAGFTFDFTTRGGTDGIDFQVAGDQCARFVLNVQGNPDSRHIYLGRNGYHAPGGRFWACP